MAKQPDTPAAGLSVGAQPARRGRFVLTTPALRAIFIGGLIGIGMLLVALAMLRRLPS